MTRHEIIFFHVCMKVGYFWCWKPNQPKRVTPCTYISFYYCLMEFQATHRWVPTGTCRFFVYWVLSLPSAQGCQSPPITLFSLSDRFYMHRSCLRWTLCSSEGLLLRIKACLTPVVSLHCSEQIAMCSWCLNCLNASSEHYFNGHSLGWYTLMHTVY